ncbi:hypothetical protein F164LOC_15215 [Pectobacterium carotovorum]|nr:hypothetical protein F164LOC_15215 [Pectobacterium carotovorum]
MRCGIKALSVRKVKRCLNHLYSSYFKLHVRWLRSVTRITYLSKLIGIPSLAAFLKLELFRVCIFLSRHGVYLTAEVRGGLGKGD